MTFAGKVGCRGRMKTNWCHHEVSKKKSAEIQSIQKPFFAERMDSVKFELDSCMQNPRAFRGSTSTNELEVSIPAPLKYAAKLLSLLSKCHPQPELLRHHVSPKACPHMPRQVAFLPLLPLLPWNLRCTQVPKEPPEQLKPWRCWAGGWMDSLGRCMFFLVLFIAHHRPFMQKTIPVEPGVSNPSNTCSRQADNCVSAFCGTFDRNLAVKTNEMKPEETQEMYFMIRLQHYDLCDQIAGHFMEFLSWTVSPCFRAGGISSSSSFAHWWWQTVVLLGNASETNHCPMSYGINNDLLYVQGGWAPWDIQTAPPSRWQSWATLHICRQVVGMTSTLQRATSWGMSRSLRRLGRSLFLSEESTEELPCATWLENAAKIAWKLLVQTYVLLLCKFYNSSSVCTLKRQMSLSQLRVLMAANL